MLIVNLALLHMGCHIQKAMASVNGKKGGQVTKFRRTTLERSEIATLLVLKFRRRT